MKLHLSWSRIDTILIVLGIVLILVIYLLPQTPIIFADFVAAFLGAWFYLGYSYRSIVPRPRLARYSIYRASIAAILGVICLGIVCWIIWSLWAGVSLALPRILTIFLLVVYSLLREHERRDVREAIQANTKRDSE